MSHANGLAKWVLRGLVALLASYFAWNSLYYFPYIVDDTFISLRYAYNLVDGQGLVYNPGQRIEGFSNFSWVMLEALLLALGLPAVSAIKLIGLASGLGTIVLTYLLAGRLFAGQPLCGLKSLLAVGFVCLNTSLAIWAQAGLETVFLALLLVATCLRYEVELARENAFPWSALLFSLAWLTRPEVPAYALYLVARRWAERTRRPWCRADLNWVIAAGAVIVPYELWGLWYYGRFFPATHNAKIGEPAWTGLAGSFERIVQQPLLGNFLLSQGWGFAAILLVGAVTCVIFRKSLPLAPWLVPVCGLIFVLYAHDDWMPRHRLFVPVLPFIGLFASYGLCELLLLARRRRGWVILWCLLFLVVSVDYTRFQMFGGSRSAEPYPNFRSFGGNTKRARNASWFLEVPRQVTRRVYPLRGTSQFLLDSLPPGEYVCLRDIGLPGYLTMNPIWDLVGLVTPTAARARHERSQESEQVLYEELLAIRPGCFYLSVPEGEVLLSNTIDSWLRTDPAFRVLYREVSRVAKGRSDYVVYLRKDLPAVDRQARLSDAQSRVPGWTGVDSVASALAAP